MTYVILFYRSAVLKVESKYQSLEYSTDDTPPWFGYDRYGNLFNGMSPLEESDTTDEPMDV